MNEQLDLNEGEGAFRRFQNAVKVVLSVPKTALPPRPTRKKKRAKTVAKHTRGVQE